MIMLFLITIVIALGVGIAAKWYLKKTDGPKAGLEITWAEYAVAALVILVVLTPLTLRSGFAIARGNAVKFNEYWNGWEKEAVQTNRRCSRDSGCHYTYDCDPYTVMVPYSYPCGKSTCTGLRAETHYHSCPYGNEEWTFDVRTTLGEFRIATTIPDGPGFRGRGVPGHIPRGVPASWQDCKERLAADDPGPVTVRKTYDNYILASDQTILRQYSDRIAELKRVKLLPPVQHGLHSFYWADKISWVGGVTVPNAIQWQLALGRLNAALGSELQGDMHLVMVPGTVAPDAYITALKAHWTDPKVFKRDAISKNTIIVAIGVGDGKVTWARATTGMPVGNEAMTIAIKDQLPGTPLDPEKLIGHVRGKDGGERHVIESGALAKIVLTEGSTQFKRVSMTAEDKNDLGTGFKYLSAAIQPSTGAKVLMVFVALILASGMWFACVLYTGKRRAQ